ncbi:MAG: aminotransferase class V-fold PLP-dependent enzyme [Pseudomonadota bacterium]
MTEYGDAAKPLWPLEPGMIFLNHGSYGATPRTVLDVQRVWRDRLEAQPCQFINAIAPGAIREAAGALAQFLGAEDEDLVFVENTTQGINAILRSMQFAAEDEVVVTDHVYNAVRNTLNFVLEPAGARLVVANVGLPLARDGLVDRVMAAASPKTRLIVIDHVASVSGVVFPVAEIAAAARARGIKVLVDGAHAPGMLDLNVPAIGADYYVGNCHKWLCAPKGAAFLWAAKARQDGLHPTVISHDLGKGFTFEFDKVGTRDASAWLSVPEAIAFHEAMGGAALRARNHAVATSAAAALAARWDTQMGAPAHLFGALATVRAPDGLPADRPTADRLKAWLWHNHRAEIHVMPFCGALWVRLSVQAYNSEDECLAVGELVPAGIAALGREAV